jgi:ubiquinone/menaquinone biosynthesis C-methylase UbiE
MKSKTISLWDAIIKNPPESFKEYFDEEKKFIEKNILKDDIVLDLGCGTGRTVKIISKICKLPRAKAT